MRITDIEVIELRVPGWTGETFDGSYDNCLVLVHTDAGIAGIAEVDSVPAVIRAIVDAPRSHSHAMGLKEAVVGADPSDVEGLWERMYDLTSYYGRRGVVIHAISAVDIALWDLRGKMEGKSVSRLLGKRQRDSLLAYGTVYPLGETPDEVKKNIDRGLKLGLKAIKIVADPFWREDLDKSALLIRTARQHVGKDIRLMVDAATIAGVGPFAEHGAYDGLLSAQFFLAVTGISALLVASLASDLLSRDVVEAALDARYGNEPPARVIALTPSGRVFDDALAADLDAESLGAPDIPGRHGLHGGYGEAAAQVQYFRRPAQSSVQGIGKRQHFVEEIIQNLSAVDQSPAVRVESCKFDIRYGERLLEQGQGRSAGNRGSKLRGPAAAAVHPDADDRQVAMGEHAARRAASRLSDEQLLELRASCDRFETLSAADDLRELVRENFVFHNTILAAAGDTRLAGMVRQVVELPLVYKSYVWYSPEQARISQHYHRQICRALERRDAERAELVMKEHVLEARDVLIAHVQVERSLAARAAEAE